MKLTIAGQGEELPLFKLEKELEVLARLGLTNNQARIYFALVNSMDLTASQLSEVSGVGREEIYKIMPKLQNLGLIQTSVTKPAKFSAVPPQKGVEILLEIRQKEAEALQDKAKDFCSFTTTAEKGNVPDEPKLTLISGKERLVQLSTELLEAVQRTLGIVATSVKLRGWLTTHGNSIKRLLERGISTRFIVEITEEEQRRDFAELFLEYSNFRLKVTETKIPSCIGLYDDREITIIAMPRTMAYGSMVYWSNNPAIIGLGRAYFEALWIA